MSSKNIVCVCVTLIQIINCTRKLYSWLIRFRGIFVIDDIKPKIISTSFGSKGFDWWGEEGGLSVDFINWYNQQEIKILKINKQIDKKKNNMNTDTSDNTNTAAFPRRPKSSSIEFLIPFVGIDIGGTLAKLCFALKKNS